MSIHYAERRINAQLVFMSVSVHTHSHKHTYTHLHTRARAHAHARTHTLTLTLTCTRVHALKNTLCLSLCLSLSHKHTKVLKGSMPKSMQNIVSFYRALLQKRPIILRSLLSVAHCNNSLKREYARQSTTRSDGAIRSS